MGKKAVWGGYDGRSTYYDPKMPLLLLYDVKTGIL